jgi:hypothetical protein
MVMQFLDEARSGEKPRRPERQVEIVRVEDSCEKYPPAVNCGLAIS